MTNKKLRQIKESSDKHTPGYTLEEMGFPGMHLYNGYLQDNFRFRAYVPTTIFDPKVAALIVYRLENYCHQFPQVPEEVVARETVPLESMPYWDVRYQAIMLSRQDHESVMEASKNLEKKVLSENNS